MVNGAHFLQVSDCIRAPTTPVLEPVHLRPDQLRDPDYPHAVPEARRRGVHGKRAHE